MKRGKESFGGQEYDLSHLDPCVIQVQSDANPTRKILVRFGAHVFTKEWKNDHAVDLRYMDGNTPRCFCQDRYALSVDLPGIVMRATAGRALLSPQRRFIVFGNPPGAANPYGVFFSLRQATKNYYAIMDVVSAHERPHLPPMPSLQFHELLELVGAGTFKWPKK